MKRHVSIALLFNIAFHSALNAQSLASLIRPPEGNNVRSMTFDGSEFLSYTENIVFSSSRAASVPGLGSTLNTAPNREIQNMNHAPEREIMWFMQKTDDLKRILSLLDDGSVVEFVLSAGGESGINFSVPQQVGKIPNNNGYSFRKMEGDALYAMDANAIFVSRDTARTWEIDTLGLNLSIFDDVRPRDFAIDTLQDVYATTKNGLYKQHTDSSRWYLVDSVYYKENGTVKHHSMGSVYVNRSGVIFASPVNDPFNPFAPVGLFRSNDNGTSWMFVQSASSDFPYGSDVSGFGEDAFGNLYAIQAPGDRLFRSSNLGESWVRIDTPITNRVKPIPSAAKFFNSISGDTLLYAGTAMGMFVSSDQGTTWHEANEGIEDENPLGLAVTSAGKFVYSGTVGLSAREEEDTAWTKVHPVNGYQQFGPLSTDNDGNLYTLAEPAFQFGPRRVIKSTDGGSTWHYDTLGVSSLKGSSWVWYVDETGTQRMARGNFGIGEPSLLYKKSPGGPWVIDTAGYMGGGVDQPRFFFSDKSGSLYVGGDMTVKLWKRPIAGGSWVPDTTGLTNAVVAMGAAKSDGTPYVASGFSFISPSKLFRRSGNEWVEVTAPAGRSGDWITAISANSTGAVFVAYQRFFTGLGGGVYSTTDDGTTWNFHGMDSIIVNQLVSYGESTYALTTGRGAYDLNGSLEPTSVGSVLNSRPAGFALHQNYPNPFNPVTTISFQIPEVGGQKSDIGRVTLKIYDLLGREIAILVNEERKSGLHSVRFDASRFSSGVYFYTLKAGNYSASKKLLLMK